MAYVKLSDLPLIESPTSSATVIGVNNGTTGRFTYSASSSESSIWSSIEEVSVTGTVSVLNDTYLSILFDLSSATLNKEVLYVPKMVFSDTDVSTYGLTNYNNKLLQVTPACYSLSGSYSVSKISIKLPNNLDHKVYLMTECDRGSGNAVIYNAYSPVSTIYVTLDSKNYEYPIQGGELHSRSMGSATMLSNFQLECFTIEPTNNISEYKDSIDYYVTKYGTLPQYTYQTMYKLNVEEKTLYFTYTVQYPS